MENLTIIGTGPAGLTAAIYAARANLEPLVLSGNLPGGQLTQTTEVENYPGFTDGIQGYELMDILENQAKRFGARIQSETVVKAELKDGGPQRLHLTEADKILKTKALIIASGASPRWLGLESEEKLKNKGVSCCATCDGAFFRGQKIVVVGGGDSALEEALFLTRFATMVTVVHRRAELRASKIMQERAFKHEKIEFQWDSVVQEIMGVDAGKVTGVRLENVKNKKVQELECGAVFVAIGHEPNTAAFQDTPLKMDDEGYIVLPGRGAATGIAGVFAAGDCADRVYRQAVTAAGMGCQAAIEAERWLEA